MDDTWAEINRLRLLNEERIDALKNAYLQRAENEREYRKARATATLEERAKGTAVTILSDIILGREDIADLRFNRDVADGMVDSYNQEIQANKLSIRVLEAEREREWSIAGGNTYGA